MRITVHVLAYLDQDYGPPLISVHPSTETATAQLARILTDQWDRVAGRDGVPAEPDDLNDADLIAHYMRVRNGLDSYTVTEHVVDVAAEPARSSDH